MKFFVFFLLVIEFNEFSYVRSRYIDCWPTYDYDFTYDYPEVVYLPPEKVRNIIDFLNKLSTTPRAKIITERTEEEVTTTVKHQEDTTTTSEPTTTSTEPTTKAEEPTTKGEEQTTTSTEATNKSTEATTKYTEATTKSTEATTISTEATTVQEVQDPVEDIGGTGLVESGQSGIIQYMFN